MLKQWPRLINNTMEEKTLQQRIDEVTEWLENNEIDHEDYPEKFAELQRLEEEILEEEVE
jgi:aconitase B